MIVAIPNYVHDEINAMLDRELDRVPEAAFDRPWIYSALLRSVFETGKMPTFRIERKLLLEDLR